MPAIKRFSLLYILTRSILYKGFLFSFLFLFVCIALLTRWFGDYWLYMAVFFLVCQDHNFHSTFPLLSCSICRHPAASGRQKRHVKKRMMIKFYVICISSFSVKCIVLKGKVCSQKANNRIKLDSEWGTLENITYDLWVNVIYDKSCHKYLFYEYTFMQSFYWKRALWTNYKPQKTMFYGENVDSL